MNSSVIYTKFPHTPIATTLKIKRLTATESLGHFGKQEHIMFIYGFDIDLITNELKNMIMNHWYINGHHIKMIKSMLNTVNPQYVFRNDELVIQLATQHVPVFNMIAVRLMGSVVCSIPTDLRTYELCKTSFNDYHGGLEHMPKEFKTRTGWLKWFATDIGVSQASIYVPTNLEPMQDEHTKPKIE